MSVARVLLLDISLYEIIGQVMTECGVPAQVTVGGIEMETLTQRYPYSPQALNIATTATPHQFDLVVVGNNRGTGLKYVRLLSAEMRQRTLVVWNDYQPGMEIDYLELGCSHFGTRESQVDLLIEMFRAL